MIRLLRPGERAVSTYNLEGPKWANNTITWSFAPAGGSFTNAVTGAYQAIIEQALSRWAQVVNVSFQQVRAGTAGTDILIGWSDFSASPLVPGGAQIGETDYAYTGSGSNRSFSPGMLVRIEDPALDPVGTSISSAYQGTLTTLYQVALHEIGHALGLGLDTNPAAVMYLTLGPANTDLGASDIAGAQSLYGAAAGVTQSQVAANSPAAATQAHLPAAIVLSGNDVAVYRFFGQTDGTQFLTADVTERNSIIQTRPDLVYEGLGMAAMNGKGSDPAAVPVYRFFDTHNGTHFFTVSASEEQALLATRPDLSFESSSFYEHATQQAGDVPVYRFYDQGNGTHFFTASESERAGLVAGRPDMTYEGVAFYSPNPAT